MKISFSGVERKQLVHNIIVIYYDLYGMVCYDVVIASYFVKEKEEALQHLNLPV